MADERPYEDTPLREIEAELDDALFGVDDDQAYEAVSSVGEALLGELGHVRAERDLSRTRFSELSATHVALEEYASELARELEGCRAHIGRLLSQQVDDLDPLRPFRPGLSPFDNLLE